MTTGGRAARRWRHAAVALALVGTVGSLAVGCSSGPHGPLVAVIGDSITFLAAPDIRSDLGADGDRVLLTGRIGFTAAQLGGDVADFARQRPKVVLLEMGTNDASQSITGATSAAAFEAAVDRYARAFGSACLIATTVGSHRGTPIQDGTADAINTWLEVHFVRLVDWNAYEWAQRQAGHRLVQVDNVHPNADGQAALASLDQAAVRSCLSAGSGARP